MRRLPLRVLFAPLLLTLTGCGSGGGAPAAATPATAPLLLTLDTAAGVDAAIAVQVAAVALERVDGSATANLLAAPRALRLCDPAGDVTGLRLDGAPSADYAAVHLILAPGSAQARAADGATTPVEFPAWDLRAPFAAPLHHDGAGGWIDLRHAAPLQLGMRGAGFVAAPALLAAPAIDRGFDGVTLTVATAAGDALSGMLGDDGVPVQAVLAGDAALRDEDGAAIDAAAFVAACAAGRDIAIGADALPDDRLLLREGRLGTRSDRPRLIGRIAELAPDRAAFVLRVLAVTRGGHRDDLADPERVLVHTDGARITFSHTDRELQFADLRVDDLAKVSVTARRDDGSVDAGAIEITARGDAPAQPLWNGIVRAVRPDADAFELGPLGDRLFTVGDRRLERLRVRVTADTALERVGDRGPVAIGVADLVPDHDRAQVRGELQHDDLGEPFVHARSVRVQALR